MFICFVTFVVLGCKDESVFAMLVSLGADLKTKDKNSWTFLHWATEGLNDVAVKYGLETGIQIMIGISNISKSSTLSLSVEMENITPKNDSFLSC